MNRGSFPSENQGYLAASDADVGGGGSVTALDSAGTQSGASDFDVVASSSTSETAVTEFVSPEQAVDPVLSIVLPTKDEENGIGECLDRIRVGLRQLGLTAEVIVSDDSHDRTAEIASSQGARVVEPPYSGYGYAYRYAFEHIRGDYVVMGDADTTYDFAELPRLIEPILAGEADMVLGSRLKGEIKPGAMPPLHQYVGNPLLTKFLNVFYGAGVSDAHSGFRVFRTELLDELDFQTDGMEFASEMVMDASTRGIVIEEVPITYHERTGEATLNSFRDGWRHVKFMLMNAPQYLFTIPAGLMIAVGALLMVLSMLDTQLGGVTYGNHTMIAGSLSVIVGYQTGLLSVFTSIATDPIGKPNDPLTRWVEDNFRLEHGATLGLVLLTVGAVYAAFLVSRWIAVGPPAIPFVPADMLAFTLIVVGVETVFSSFHLSALAAAHQSPSPASLLADETMTNHDPEGVHSGTD